MEVKRIANSLRDLNGLFSDNSVVFFKSFLGETNYFNLKNGTPSYRVKCVIDNTGGTKTYNYSVNYHSDKKKPCEFCGEYGEWTKDYSDVKHSKKNCPYKYLWGIEDGKRFQKLIQKIGHYERVNYREKMKIIQDFDEEKNQMDASRNELIKVCEEKCCAKEKELDDMDKELKLFKRIMPQDTIKERYEQHRMMCEEQEQKKLMACQKVKEADEKICEMKKQEQLVELNGEMRNIKIKNLEHKCQLMEQTIKDKNLQQEEYLVVHNAKLNSLRGEKSQVDKELKRNKIHIQAVEAGAKDCENLNEKLIKILKEGGNVCDEVCSICQLDIVDEEMTLKCGHKFHSSCLPSYWLSKCREDRYKMTYKCPNCRGESLKLSSYSNY